LRRCSLCLCLHESWRPESEGCCDGECGKDAHGRSFPFRFEKPEKVVSAKFGWRLNLMWPFGESNAAAMRARKPAVMAGIMRPTPRG
jgi:hypothetical protein